MSFVDENNDKDGNGYVDADEAFKATDKIAEKYFPKLMDYIKTKYKPAKPVPRSLMNATNIRPKIWIGPQFKMAKLGPPVEGDGTAKKGKKKRGRKKRGGGSRDPGKKVMTQAQLWESGQNYNKAIDLYKQVVSMGEQTKYAKEAQECIDELLADPEIAAAYEAYQKEQKIEETLAMAQSLYLAGQHDEALKYCDEVMEKAPDTKHAKEAKKLKREIEKQLKEKAGT
jgi:tetratricopeptide (TPR) repeat protein